MGLQDEPGPVEQPHPALSSFLPGRESTDWRVTQLFGPFDGQEGFNMSYL